MQTHITTELKRLLKVLNDSREGYLNASESADSQMLKELFLRFASQRIGYATELKGYIHLLGTDAHPEENTVIDTLHKTWVDIKHFLRGGKDEAMLDAMLISEQSAIAQYDEILNQENLDLSYLKLLQKQRTGILESLKEIETYHISLER